MAPFLLGSQSSTNDDLFLISDKPAIYLPAVLEKLRSQYPAYGRNFSILNAHPQKKGLSQALKASGWTQAFSLQKAEMKISFRPLQQPTPPSFTLVRAGKVWDVRKKLLSLWQEMNEKHTLSSCLTIATLQARQPGRSQGKFVRIYHNGQVVEEASLHKDRIQTFWAEQGKITVKIEQGNVFVPSSSCRHKICCSVPPVSFVSDRIVCAPNHFLLEVQGPSLIRLAKPTHLQDEHEIFFRKGILALVFFYK
jgi:hypothetical protein